MARITVEDCASKVNNRFELVIMAAQRAKDINSGAHVMLEKNNDKSAVIALREIASGQVAIETLRESLFSRVHTRNLVDEVEDENLHVDGPDDEFEYIADDENLFREDGLASGDDQLFDDEMEQDIDDEL